jgi:SRSO17 transposase
MPALATIDESFAIEPAELTQTVRGLDHFLDRYKPLMRRSEQREHLGIYVGGLMSGLERKSVEPIATLHGLYRRPLQHFVGAGVWSDEAVRREMRAQLVEEIGDEEGVLVIDGSGFKKQGSDSVGVARQWCGRLGKIDNCQIGVYVGYSTSKGQSLLDARLYMPEEWIDDTARRAATHVPEEVAFKTSWQLADDMLRGLEEDVPHAWIVGDDEFGRPGDFRDSLADRGQKYLFEVPRNTLVRRPDGWPGRRKKWRQAHCRMDTLPTERWQTFRLRDAEKGPVDVRAYCTRVETRREGAPPRDEILLVMQTLTGSRTWFFVAPCYAPLDTAKLVAAAAHRHHVEQIFEAAKGEVGFAHYEVRSWVGWHHHMTLSMLALAFLTVERRRLRKKLLN